MQNRSLVVFLAAVAAVAMSRATQAQEPVARVVPTKLVRPHYPQIAQSARVRGVIIVDVYVRRDGHLDSAIVLNRVPLLELTAQQAAWATEFECRNCTAELTPYTLVYSFEMDQPSGHGPSPDDITATPFQTQIRIGAVTPILDTMLTRRDR